MNWMFNIVKYPEDNFEEILPPRLLELMAIRFHDLEHDCQPAAIRNDINVIQQRNIDCAALTES